MGRQPRVRFAGQDGPVDRQDIDIESVLRRCTAFAAELLIELSLHPAYPASIGEAH